MARYVDSAECPDPEGEAPAEPPLSNEARPKPGLAGAAPYQPPFAFLAGQRDGTQLGRSAIRKPKACGLKCDLQSRPKALNWPAFGRTRSLNSSAKEVYKVIYG
jgi:hypothetical protein